jgi:hypothetical protein
MWRVAWNQFTAHPLAGSGAATYEDAWLLGRRHPVPATTAHSLYLQTLAELGAAGLVLLLAALAIPIAVGVRLRGDPVAVAALAGLLVFVAHSTVDWDWQLTGVGAVPVICSAVVLSRARGARTASLRVPGRVSLPVAAGLGVLTMFLLVGNLQLDRSSAALTEGRPAAATAIARSASSWTPWSYQAPLELGQAQLASGQRAHAASAFRRAIDRQSRNWFVWFELARATSGDARRQALSRARALNPLSPEIVAFCDKRPFTAGCEGSR